MRRLSLTAFLAVPALLFAVPGAASADGPPGYEYFGWGNYGYLGCSGACFKKFPFIHQHGPLFNYGPYYGYYPFAPYGPWDAYLRYDPNFYGGVGAGDVYGLNPRLRHYAEALHKIHGALSGLFHHGHCGSCNFFHASWLQGGWFRGHKWLDGGHGCCPQPACNACGGVSGTPCPPPPADPAKKYSGIGTPTQSAVFYTATPTLDPVLELVPTAGRVK